MNQQNAQRIRSGDVKPAPIGYIAQSNTANVNQLYSGKDYKITAPFLSNPRSHEGDRQLQPETLCVNLEFTTQHKNNRGEYRDSCHVSCKISFRNFVMLSGEFDKEVLFEYLDEVREFAKLKHGAKKASMLKAIEVEDAELNSPFFMETKVSEIKKFASNWQFKAHLFQQNNEQQGEKKKGRQKKNKGPPQQLSILDKYTASVEKGLQTEKNKRKATLEAVYQQEAFDTLQTFTKLIPVPLDNALDQSECPGKVIDVFRKVLRDIDRTFSTIPHGTIYPTSLIAPRYVTGPGTYISSSPATPKLSAINLFNLGFSKFLKYLTQKQAQAIPFLGSLGKTEARKAVMASGGFTNTDVNDASAQPKQDSGYVFKQPASILATLNSQLCGNNVFIEKFVTLFTTALWKEKTIPELLLEYERNGIDLFNHFVFDNNRGYYQLKREMRYDFRRQVLHEHCCHDKGTPIGEEKKVLQQDADPLLKLIHKLIVAEGLSPPLVLTLSYVKRQKRFIQTTVIKVKRNEAGKPLIIDIESLDGHQYYEYTEENWNSINEKKGFIAKCLFNALKRHCSDPNEQAKKRDVQDKAKKDKEDTIEEKKSQAEKDKKLKADKKKADKIAFDLLSKEEQHKVLEDKKVQKAAKLAAQKDKQKGAKAQVVEEEKAQQKQGGQEEQDPLLINASQPLAGKKPGELPPTQPSTSDPSYGFYEYCDIYSLHECKERYTQDPRMYAIQLVIELFRNYKRIETKTTKRIIDKLRETITQSESVVSDPNALIESLKMHDGTIQIGRYNLDQFNTDLISRGDLKLDKIFYLYAMFDIPKETTYIFALFQKYLEEFGLLSEKGGLTLEKGGYQALFSLYQGLQKVNQEGKRLHIEQQEENDANQKMLSILDYEGVSKVLSVAEQEDQLKDIIFGIVQGIIMFCIEEKLFSDIFDNRVKWAHDEIKEFQEYISLSLVERIIMEDQVFRLLESRLINRKHDKAAHIEAIKTIRNTIPLSEHQREILQGIKDNYLTHFRYVSKRGTSGDNDMIYFSMSDLYSNYSLLQMIHRFSHRYNEIHEIIFIPEEALRKVLLLDTPRIIQQQLLPANYQRENQYAVFDAQGMQELLENGETRARKPLVVNATGPDAFKEVLKERLLVPVEALMQAKGLGLFKPDHEALLFVFEEMKMRKTAELNKQEKIAERQKQIDAGIPLQQQMMHQNPINRRQSQQRTFKQRKSSNYEVDESGNQHGRKNSSGIPKSILKNKSQFEDQYKGNSSNLNKSSDNSLNRSNKSKRSFTSRGGEGDLQVNTTDQEFLKGQNKRLKRAGNTVNSKEDFNEDVAMNEDNNQDFSSRFQNQDQFLRDNQYNDEYSSDDNGMEEQIIPQQFSDNDEDNDENEEVSIDQLKGYLGKTNQRISVQVQNQRARENTMQKQVMNSWGKEVYLQKSQLAQTGFKIVKDVVNPQQISARQKKPDGRVPQSNNQQDEEDSSNDAKSGGEQMESQPQLMTFKPKTGQAPYWKKRQGYHRQGIQFQGASNSNRGGQMMQIKQTEQSQWWNQYNPLAGQNTSAISGDPFDPFLTPGQAPDLQLLTGGAPNKNQSKDGLHQRKITDMLLNKSSDNGDKQEIIEPFHQVDRNQTIIDLTKPAPHQVDESIKSTVTETHSQDEQVPISQIEKTTEEKPDPSNGAVVEGAQIK